MTAKIVRIEIPEDRILPDIIQSFSLEENYWMLKIGSESLNEARKVVASLTNEEIFKKVESEFNNEIKEKGFYKQTSELESQISTLRSQIREIKIEEAKSKVFSEEGLSLEKARSVQMKFNYTPRIKNIKLVDVNAKGTRAKAVFTYAHGDHVSYEENVNVAKVLEQVL